MEDRLPSLIQKQLDAIIKQRPPLFPWETEFSDYETTEPEFGNPKPIEIPTPSPELNRDR